VVVALLAAAHLLFAGSNFGLAEEEEGFFSVPQVEGILSLLAGISLVVASILLFLGRLFKASAVALAGTIPLPVFFAFTVPEHSGWIFLFASLVLPGIAAATLYAARP